jgi:hypothetical protein
MNNKCKFGIDDIIEGEKMLKILENEIALQNMKNEMLKQKIAQKKKGFESMKYEMKKMKNIKERNEHDIELLEKENNFLQDMILYTKRTKK